ncbi:MAG: amino-acid N-acetyltransferase [Burkholderiaceae bacterium]
MNDIESPALHAPIPQTPPVDGSMPHESEPDSRFVSWFRAVAPYIHAFRGKTCVIGLAGELVAEGRLNTLVHDLSLLNALGLRIVLTYGSRPQVVEQLRLRGLNDQYMNNVRITDVAALECVKEAAGELRLDIEAAFSQGLPNTPMAHATVKIVSGNFVTARPIGVLNGVDHLHTGVVRKVDAATIRFALDSGAMVLLSPLGFSPTGEAFNLSMEDVATATAVALDADKLVFLTEFDGVLDSDGALIPELTEADARGMLDSGHLHEDNAFYLRNALKACEGGVARAHLVPFRTDGGLLLELFRHDGVGTMLVEETLDALREATIDDVGGILSIIRPLEEEGVLVKRDHALIERDIDHFSVIEHDGVIFGCAALNAFPEEKIGEMACLAVGSGVQGQGDGERLLRHIEHRARSAGLERIYVLTTRTMHWFIKRGFVPASVDELPAGRRNIYNWERRSQILIKRL